MKTKNHLMMTGHYTIISNEIMRFLGNDSAILLSYLSRKNEDFKNHSKDGFFFNIAEDIQKGTNLTRWKYENALEKLENEGFVETKTEGSPPKKYFKINEISIKNKIEEITQTDNFDLSATNKSNCKAVTTTNKAITKNLFCCPSDNNKNPSDFCNAGKIVLKPIIKKKDKPVIASKRELMRTGIKETLANNKAARVLKKKIANTETTTFEIENIVDYWDKKGLGMHKRDTISFNKAVRTLKLLLKGTLFNSFTNRSNHNRKFSMEEIKRAIDNFELAAYNMDYEPVHKKYLQSVKFSEFFYSNRPTPKEEDKSMFLKYLLNKPILHANSPVFAAKDVYPHASKILTDWYKKTFGNRDDGKYTLKNRNDIIFASQGIGKFYEQNKDKLNIKNWLMTYNQTNPISFLAEQVTRAMDKILRENENMFVSFTTGWLKSEKMFEERLPMFLHNERMMK